MTSAVTDAASAVMVLPKGLAGEAPEEILKVGVRVYRRRRSQ
jgi:hypothetical protein